MADEKANQRTGTTFVKALVKYASSSAQRAAVYTDDGMFSDETLPDNEGSVIVEE